MKLSPCRVARLGAAMALGVGACVGAQAQSSVQLYGLIDLAVGSYETSGSSRLGRVESGGMTTSYIGFSGKEDLGGGLAVNFALDHFLRADTGEAARFNGDTFWARNANVGLSGSFGTVTLGRRSTPMFVSTLLFNPFGDSFGFSPAIRSYYGSTGTLAGDSGWSNGITYASPRFGGLSATLTYALDETPGARDANIGGNVLYFAGPIGLSFSAQRVQAVFDSGDETAVQLGASYALGALKLFGQYGQIREDQGAVDSKDKIFQLGASYKIGEGSVLASYGSRKTTGTTESKRDIASLGYDHFLSKRTDVYAVYMYDKIRDTDSGNTVAFGIRHRF